MCHSSKISIRKIYISDPVDIPIISSLLFYILWRTLVTTATTTCLGSLSLSILFGSPLSSGQLEFRLHKLSFWIKVDWIDKEWKKGRDGGWEKEGENERCCKDRESEFETVASVSRVIGKKFVGRELYFVRTLLYFIPSLPLSQTRNYTRESTWTRSVQNLWSWFVAFSFSLSHTLSPCLKFQICPLPCCIDIYQHTYILDACWS